MRVPFAAWGNMICTIYTLNSRNNACGVTCSLIRHLRWRCFTATGRPTSILEAPLTRPWFVLAISHRMCSRPASVHSCQVVVDIEGTLDVPPSSVVGAISFFLSTARHSP